MWRKALSSATFDNPVTWKVWCWCILRANYEPIPIDFQGEEIKLKRGQFVTGSYTMSGELNLTKSTVWRHLHKLEKWGNISLRSGQRFTVVTVCNYEEYQTPDFVLETRTERERNENESRTGTDKEYKNTRNKEHKPQGEDLENSKDPKDEKQSLEFHLLTHWGNDGRMGWGVMTKFVDLQRKHGEKKVRDAIEIAGEMNKKSFAYVRGIVEGGKDHSQREIDKFLGRTK